MQPPLPEASQPSNTTHTGGPTRPPWWGSSRPAISRRRRSRSGWILARRAASSDAVSFLVRSSDARVEAANGSAPVAVRDRHAAVLPERLRGDPHTDRGLAALVLGDVDQADDPLHRVGVVAEVDE